MTLYRIEANREMLARGSHLPGTFAFSVVTQQPISSVWSGEPLGKDQVIYLGPNGTLDHKTCTSYRAYFMEINADAFLASAQTLTGRDVEADLAKKILLSPTPRTAKRLQTGIRQILHLAQAESGLFNRALAQRQVLHEVLGQVMDVVVDSYTPDTLPGRFKNRRRLVQEAEALMDSRPDGALTILDLCENLCVSERGLHYAFRDMLGQSPIAYYRHKRLNAVRRLLKQARGRYLTVVAAGLVHGFWHTGQFAADYRRLFGELPSDTLAGAYRKS